MDITELNEQLQQNHNSHINMGEYPALTLAYVGDAVFELCVRSKLIAENSHGVNALNKKARSYVNAASQAQMYHKIVDVLSGDELAVLKRGRNAKSSTIAKNASVTDYRHATGLETLFGYLFLKGENERILELFTICINDDEKAEPE